jgi:hypothetical protein
VLAGDRSVSQHWAAYGVPVSLDAVNAIYQHKPLIAAINADQTLAMLEAACVCGGFRP